MVPKAFSISGRHSTLAPQSSSRKFCLAPGIGVASAGRFTPLTVRTIKLVPTCSAPVEPADTKASASPFLSIVSALTIPESVLWRTALTGSSSMVMFSVQGMTVNCDKSMLFLAAQLSMAGWSPKRTSSIPSPNSAFACAAPCKTHKGALSPPMASTRIFIRLTPLPIRSWHPAPPAKVRHSARACRGWRQFRRCGAECPYSHPSAGNPCWGW